MEAEKAKEESAKQQAGGKMSDKQFRFQDFDIWKKGALLGGPLFDLADALDNKRLFRFAEQLRSATLSITNNIAEGSGSISDNDFGNFLNTARRSVFEVANILLLLSKHGRMDPTRVEPLLNELEEESRMILAFRRSLTS
jgi:four helix bundle protein